MPPGITRNAISIVALLFCLLVHPARALCDEVAHAGQSPRISIDLADAPLRGFLTDLAQRYHINMLVDERVQGSLTVTLWDVPLWQALEAILTERGYAIRRLDSGLVVVEPSSAPALEVREFRLSYIEAGPALRDALKSTLTSQGEATALIETNTMVVMDTAVGVENATALLAHLDAPPRQVLIEARIVEVSSGMSRELGVMWSAQRKRIEPSVAGGGMGAVTEGVGLNLPIAHPAVSLSFNLLSDHLSVDAFLQAIEQRGQGRVLSSPSVMVLDNHEASISDGDEYVVKPYASSSIATLMANNKEGKELVPQKYEPPTFAAKLSLSVRPRIVDDGRLLLGIDTRREEFKYAINVEGYPPKSTKSARTQLLVAHGQTVVIGGINFERSTEGRDQVPWLGRLPLVGWLFSRSSDMKENKELMIFITPKIVGEDEAK